jgi:hypothetical protein
MSIVPSEPDLFFRGGPQSFDRLNDNIYLASYRLEAAFDCLNTILPCIKAGDPELIRRPDDDCIDRQADRYPALNRPADNPEVDRLADNPEIERQ